MHRTPDRHAPDTLRLAIHHYLGDPLEVLMLFPDGTGKVVTAGSDLAAGQRPQLFLPCGTFHTSRLEAGASYALLASTEWQ
jgi:predicted cupin superfamily sugar epimerase